MGHQPTHATTGHISNAHLKTRAAPTLAADDLIYCSTCRGEVDHLVLLSFFYERRFSRRAHVRKVGTGASAVICMLVQNSSPLHLTSCYLCNSNQIIQRRQYLGAKPMLNFLRSSAATILIALSIATLPGVASSTPKIDGLAIKRAVPTDIEMVRGGYGWGVGAGFLGGALLGGALAAPYYYQPGPYYPGPYYYPRAYYYPEPGYYGGGPRSGDPTAYCLQRFRSYDPRSGTYLGYDGFRHPCP
jgi:hypothetical protein